MITGFSDEPSQDQSARPAYQAVTQTAGPIDDAAIKLAQSIGEVNALTAEVVRVTDHLFGATPREPSSAVGEDKSLQNGSVYRLHCHLTEMDQALSRLREEVSILGRLRGPQ